MEKVIFNSQPSHKNIIAFQCYQRKKRHIDPDMDTKNTNYLAAPLLLMEGRGLEARGFSSRRGASLGSDIAASPLPAGLP